MTREVDFKKVPLGIWLLEKTGLCCKLKKYARTSYKTLIFILTYAIYAHYTLSRKPFGVLKVVLCPQCTTNDNSSLTDGSYGNSTTVGWAPFNGPNGRTLLGSVDYSLLFAYALGNFISGQIADRVNIRYFLTVGMLGVFLASGVMGLGYFLQVHHLSFFIIVQLFHGFMQSTGWPGVSGVMATWFGKKNRGVILGILTSCSQFGNIAGNVLAAFWLTEIEEDTPWGWSFFIPSFMVAGLALVIFLLLVTDPTRVGFRAEIQNLPSDDVSIDSDLSSIESGDFPSSVEDCEEEITVDRIKDRDFVVVSSSKLPVSLSQLSVSNPINYERDNPVLNEGGDISSLRVPEQFNEVEPSVTSEEVQSEPQEKVKAINFFRAFMIPGVIEFCIAFFFNKLVAFTFFFWLPFYVKTSLPELSGKEAAWLSTLFDAGGIFGAIVVGFVSDKLRSRSLTCVVLLILAIPLMFLLRMFGSVSLGLYATLLFSCGIVVNGPYGLISGAVSNDLGTHKSLKSNTKAKSTVSGIINGTGSIGAAVGPLLIGVITDHLGWDSAFYCLMICCFVAALSLSRLVIIDVIAICKRINHSYHTRRSKPKGKEVPNTSTEHSSDKSELDMNDQPKPQFYNHDVCYVTAL